MSLSKAQKSALKKLTSDFQSADRIGESITTLNALVTKGHARRRAPHGTHNLKPSEVLYALKD